MSESIGVVIVTRDHGRTIGPVLDGIAAQTLRPVKTVVIDCGSSDLEWVEPWSRRDGFEIVPLGRNAGFSGGNNEGWRRLDMADGLVLFLNPDVLIPPDLLERMSEFSTEERARTFAAWSVRLLRWDVEHGVTTAEIDSTGIFPCWHGWKDRREDVPAASDMVEIVPALCGAFFMARVAALRAVVRPDGTVWDERYLAYKEDVELSLRLRRAGGELAIWHGAEAWHGRGWSPVRSAMPREARLLSARNEVLLHREYAPWRLPMSLVKLAAVRWLNR